MTKPANAVLTLLNFLLLSAQCVPAAAQDTPPNVIIILADDLGYADIEGYGAPYQTPNLSEMQQDGMRFTSFYAKPVCSPARAALMTGCYPQRVGFPGVVGPKGPAWTANKYKTGLNAGEETLAELLKKKGYATACIGKWHLGHLPEHLPTRHGFDEFWGLPYSNDMWPVERKEWPDLPLMKDEKTIATNPDQRLLTKRYTEHAIDFINRNKRGPFFLYLAHSMPHVPLFVSRRFENTSGAGLYADVVRELDWSVGQIIKTLRKYRLDQNTLVIFTSDNGPSLRYGNHSGKAGVFREGKGTTFEGGVRVPMIARWPARITAGTANDAIAGLIDLLPTMAEVAGAGLPELEIDGKSILPLLTGEKQAVRDVHYYFHDQQLQAIRKGNWKLHVPHQYEHPLTPGMDGAQGEKEMPLLDLALYDLNKDPGETVNLASRYPDIVTELRQLLEEFRSEMESEKRDPGIVTP